MTSRRPVLLLVAIVLAVAGCDGADSSGRNRNWQPARAAGYMGVPAARVITAIHGRLAAPAPAPLSADQWQHVRRLYQRFATRPLWLDKHGIHERRATGLLVIMADADSDAIDLDQYPLAEIVNALGAVEGGKRPTAQQLADADVLLTAAYVAFGENMLIGQLPPASLGQAWHINPQDEQVDSALILTLREDSLAAGLARMRPQDAGYETLREQLIRYRRIVAAGGWGRIPSSSSRARIAAVRARLRLEGMLRDSTDIPTDSGAPAQSGLPTSIPKGTGLAAGISDFQRHHGIPVTGSLDDQTIAAMNVPAAFRLTQIAANLERYRWMPRTLGSRYIIVNVPQFHLDAYDSGQKALEMKVVVGAEYADRATPVFSDSMEVVTFRPYWLITDNIARKEFWPKIHADPGYLEGSGFQIYHDHGRARIRQRPGPKNSLGLVKFIFPNDFDIYLHDTPHGELFKRDVRALSHGCIRVENPVALAHFVLGWPNEKIRAQMQDGPNDHTVELPHKIPVYIVYFTAYVRDGELYFANDLYDRDSKLIEAVAPGAVPTTEAAQAAAALRRLASRP
jgi:L,D-transpeptidase YcbB